MIEGPGAVRALIAQGADALKLDVGTCVTRQCLDVDETVVAHFALIRLIVAVQVIQKLRMHGIHHGAQVATISRMVLVNCCVTSKHAPADEYLAAQCAAEPILIDVHALVLRQVLPAHEGGAAIMTPERRVPRVRDRVLKQDFRTAEVLPTLSTLLQTAVSV